jgi:hypothetical protein
MKLELRHVRALNKAEKLLVDRNFKPYFEMRELFPPEAPEGRRDFESLTPEDRKRLKALFKRFYRLNGITMGEICEKRFFKKLFGNHVIVNGKPNFEELLMDLYRVKRPTRAQAMHFSFVSKLVNMHQESSPIYDRHVLNFFQERVPAATKAPKDRIEWYVEFLDEVATNYEKWAKKKEVKTILERLKERDKRLKNCDVVRLMDFLVWKVGNQKLLKPKAQPKRL